MKIVEEGRIRFVKPEGATHWREYYRWQFWQNKGWRFANLLDVRGAEFLFEYEDQACNFHYVAISLDAKGEFSCHYRNLSPKSSWVKDCVAS